MVVPDPLQADRQRRGGSAGGGRGADTDPIHLGQTTTLGVGVVVFAGGDVGGAESLTSSSHEWQDHIIFPPTASMHISKISLRLWTMTILYTACGPRGHPHAPGGDRMQRLVHC
jgi:hypothetical protein